MTETTGSSSPAVGTSTSVQDSSQSIPSAPEVPSYKGTKHKIDFDGHEVEIDHDRLIDDFKKYAKKAYQLEQQLNPAMEFIQNLQKGDLSQLKRLGITDDVLREFSEKQLMEYIEYQNMDPREKALREREAKIEAMERRVREQEEAEKNSRLEAERAQASKQVQTDLVEAIKDLGGDFKVTPRMIRRVAEEAYARLEAGQTPDLKAIAKRQWEGLASDYSEYQSLMLKRDPKSFISSLPPDLIKAIREHELSSARPIKKVEAEKEAGFVPEKKGLGLDESFKALDNYYNRKRKQRMNQ